VSTLDLPLTLGVVGTLVVLGVLFFLYRKWHSTTTHPIKVAPVPGPAVPAASETAHAAVSTTLTAAASALKTAHEVASAVDPAKAPEVHNAAKVLANASAFASSAASRASTHVHPQEH
jgi:hypothetical protein